jgi:hypothetical protein
MRSAAMKQMPSVVKLLAERAPSSGTPNDRAGRAAVAVGVYRAGNFRLRADCEAIQELIVAAGLSTELQQGHRDQRSAREISHPE